MADSYTRIAKPSDATIITGGGKLLGILGLTHKATSISGGGWTEIPKPNDSSYVPVAKPALSQGIDQSMTDASYPEDWGDVSMGDGFLGRVAQTFLTSRSGSLSKFIMKCSKSGFPEDNIVMKIYADGGGQPGTLLGTSSNVISGSSISFSDFSTCEFDFSGISLSDSTLYWAEVSRDGNQDGNDFYQPLTSDGNTDKYPNGDTWVFVISLNQWQTANDYYGNFIADFWFEEYSGGSGWTGISRPSDPNYSKVLKPTNSTYSKVSKPTS